MTAADPSAPLLAPVLITFGMAGIATGIVLCGFGVTRMGRAIRYVPYPVVGGFLGATGCLILLGAIRVITRQRLQLANLDRFANMMTSYELVAACAMALVLYLTWHRSRTPFGLPVILIGGTIGPCRVPSGRHFRGGRTGAGLDLPAAAEGLVDAAVERDGVRPLSLVRAARPRR
jgi:sulfate permease, SulP family